MYMKTNKFLCRVETMTKRHGGENVYKESYVFSIFSDLATEDAGRLTVRGSKRKGLSPKE